MRSARRLPSASFPSGSWRPRPWLRGRHRRGKRCRRVGRLRGRGRRRTCGSQPCSSTRRRSHRLLRPASRGRSSKARRTPGARATVDEVDGNVRRGRSRLDPVDENTSSSPSTTPNGRHRARRRGHGSGAGGAGGRERLRHEREWVSQDSGPIAIRNRPSDTFRNARTMVASNWAPAHRASSARAATGEIGCLVRPRRRHHVECVGDGDERAAKLMSVPVSRGYPCHPTVRGAPRPRDESPSQPTSGATSSRPNSGCCLMASNSASVEFPACRESPPRRAACRCHAERRPAEVVEPAPVIFSSSPTMWV